MRLIDADALWDRTFSCEDAADVRKEIEIAPTVDAAPVVHGRWEWFEEWNASTPDHPKECDDCG